MSANSADMSDLAHINQSLQSQGAITKPRKLKLNSPKSPSKSTFKPSTLTSPSTFGVKQPKVEEPDDEWTPLLTPKPAKVSRKVIIDKAGTQTVSEDLEESQQPYQVMTFKRKLDAQEAQSKRDLAQHIYDVKAKNSMMLNEMAYNRDQMKRQLEAETRWKNLEMQQNIFNTHAQQQMHQSQMDHEKAMSKQKLDAQTYLKEIDLDGMKFTQKLNLADHRDARKHVERMQADQHRHTEKMVKLNNIGSFVQAHNELADGMHSRMMNNKKYHDSKQQEAYSFINTAQAQIAERQQTRLLDIFRYFGLTVNDIDTLEQPRQKEVVLVSEKYDPRYAYSVLFTGVDKLRVCNPYNPYVVFLNGVKQKLRHTGADGYTYRFTQLATYTYLIHVYKGESHGVKAAYPREYWGHKLCCDMMNCELA